MLGGRTPPSLPWPSWSRLLLDTTALCVRSAQNLVTAPRFQLRPSQLPDFLCDPIPVCTSLLGDTSDTTSAGLAQRLARKTNKQVFVSYNLQNTDSNFALLIENRIKEEMEAFPEKF
ncbi:proteasome assembly chaperone 4 isoform X1 [Fukomys damarensis]|nr:proteasome assembly chaperone 4 isoform X1 [Fukomys damarensis]